MAFEAYGLSDRSTIRRNSPKSIVLSFLNSFLLSNVKRLEVKAFLEVTLVSLTLISCTLF